MILCGVGWQEDDPEKQRKWEEREMKRQMKKKAPKMKQLKSSNSVVSRNIPPGIEWSLCLANDSSFVIDI
ncbi:hypothetical protein J6590_008994 [Homalodisca vitripennis]|nr:hypothetical protein J6590_008994 [Homalodisca vitripennis]